MRQRRTQAAASDSGVRRLRGDWQLRSRVSAVVSSGALEKPARDETRNCGEINRELLLRPEAEVVLGRAVRRCRPTARFVRFLQPEAADPNRQDIPQSLAAGDEERRSDRGCQPRAYARPGSWTAGRPVDLAAAIAQIRSRRSASASAELWRWTPSACLLLLIRSGKPARLCKRVMGAADALLVIVVLADDAEWQPESVSIPR
jgi:hypothetical protein